VRSTTRRPSSTRRSGPAADPPPERARALFVERAFALRVELFLELFLELFSRFFFELFFELPVAFFVDRVGTATSPSETCRLSISRSGVASHRRSKAPSGGLQAFAAPIR
jgi:hypothetical protein